ncbi:MAG TPA: hypothetical protein VGG24_07465 [Paraburkholderia sp.]
MTGGASLIGGLLGSNAAEQAAQTQAAAETKASQLEATTANNALNFDKQVYSNAQGYAAPYQQTGTGALQALAQGTATGGEFNSTPTSAQVMAQDPGYAFNLQQGQQALERAEAAGGSVGSGGALKAGVQYATNYATNAYGQAYNQFMGTRQANYGNLLNLAGLGEQANQTLTNAGTSAANNYSSTALSGAAAQGNDITNAAAATAAGTVGSANAWETGLGGVANGVTNGLALQALAQQGNQSGYKGVPDYVDTSDGSSAGSQ